MAELNVRLMIEREGAEAEQFDCFSDDENAMASKRLSCSISAYYTCQTNELKDIQKI